MMVVVVIHLVGHSFLIVFSRIISGGGDGVHGDGGSFGDVHGDGDGGGGDSSP